MLREGFEAALIVGILLAFLNRMNRRDAFWHVWVGAAMAVVVSLAAAGVLFLVGAELEGEAEEVWEGATMLVAAGLLTWMIFWMRTQARFIKKHLETRIESALASGSAIGLMLVAFVGVVREGIETSLFMFSTVSGTDPVVSGIGALVGTLGAVALGYAFYRGSSHLDLRRFFSITSALLLAFAAYLLFGGLHEFAEAGFLPEETAPLVGVGVLLGMLSLYWYFRKPVAKQVAPAATR
jgi:high-affinity iron transporter